MNLGPEDLRALEVMCQEPEAIRLKDSIDFSEPRHFFQFQGNTYVLRYTRLRNIGLDHREHVLELSAERGLPDPIFFSQVCPKCPNRTPEYTRYHEISDGVIIIDPDTEIIEACHYPGDPAIKVAKPYQRNGDSFYALDDQRCALTDSLVIYLGGHGYLDSFRTQIPFDFQHVSELENLPSIPERFLVQTLELKLRKELQHTLN